MFDLDFLTNLSVVSSAAIPIVLAITQALKFKWVKDEYAPFVSMLVGIGVAFFLVHDVSSNMSQTVLSGILFGLSASGVYSGLVSTKQAITQQRIKAQAEKGKCNE
jgi:hypothetical protein